MTPSQAKSAALQQFGDVARVRNEMREVRMMSRRVVGAFVLGLALGGASAGLFLRVKPAPAADKLAFYLSGIDGVSTPRLLYEAKPKYTAEAMHAKIQGT